MREDDKWQLGGGGDEKERKAGVLDLFSWGEEEMERKIRGEPSLCPEKARLSWAEGPPRQGQDRAKTLRAQAAWRSPLPTHY